jgi:plastocyanin
MTLHSHTFFKPRGGEAEASRKLKRLRKNGTDSLFRRARQRKVSRLAKRKKCQSLFSAFALAAFLGVMPVGALASKVNGKVELRDSRDPAVKNHHDYSGVVISLTPAHADALTGPTEKHTDVAPPKHAVITQKDKRFSPHVLAIPVGSYVDFPNLDPIFHNAFSSYSGQIFDVGLYPPGTSRSVRFTREGVVRVFCNIHSSMSAMIVVLGTPYFAVSRHDGSFALDDIPPGEYTLRVVHERSSETTLQGLTRSITVGAEDLVLPPLGISEAGYLSIPHKNKYGQDYAPDNSDHGMYPATRR